MNTLTNSEQMQRRRKGQTLAEFALTLPILLILAFGIVEFGRIFQAWVTLQNSARAAARYASTGQFFEDRFPMQLEFNYDDGFNDENGFVPCVDDGPEVDRTWTVPGDARGTQADVYPNTPGDPDDKITVYENGIEAIFATWNHGLNCDPRVDGHQEMRKDMARIISIMEEARQGASGLYLEANPLVIPVDKENIDGWPWFEVWTVPHPRQQERAWFNVTICSTRRMRDQKNSDPYFSRLTDDPANPVAEIRTRFVTYMSDSTLRDPAGRDLTSAPASDPRLPLTGCLLNEIPDSTDGGALNNAGKPWLDPGGPADTVTVIVTFNHPLVTPLGLAPYIQMQARRTAIVESFRSADPQQAFGDVPALEVQPPTQTFTPSFTPSQTFTPSPTATKTPLASPTPTNTQAPPFTCSLIKAEAVENGNSDGLFGNTVSINITNGNSQATFLTRVIFKWPTILDYPQMFTSELALNAAPHWRGQDFSDINSATNTTDTNTDGSIPPNFFVNTSEQDRTIAAFDTGNWTALLGNGPPLLNQYTSINGFAGTTFYLFNPLTPSTPCVIPLNVPPPTATPPANATLPTNTPTYTPDCASSTLQVKFAGFEPFGIVRLEVLSYRTVVSTMTNFSIVWVQKLPGVLTLDKVTAVAAPGVSGSVSVWVSGSSSQDSTPPTIGKSEGTWVSNAYFPAGTPSSPSSTYLYLDFGGVGGLLSDPGIGMTPSMFNGSQFTITCGSTGGGPGGPGGPGNPPSGIINLAEAPTPLPSPTQGPSNTPKPTIPPTKTPTPGPPTATKTPGPTPTPKPPTLTPSPTTPPPPPPPPTLPGGGCIDGCG